MPPPRKRARQSALDSPIPPTTASPSRVSRRQGSVDHLPVKPTVQSPPGEDGWTPEQETALLAALIEHKPAGPFKHFRMVAISQAVQSMSQLAGPSPENPMPERHLSVPGIWSKLRSLYNLDAIWERVSDRPFLWSRLVVWADRCLERPTQSWMQKTSIRMASLQTSTSSLSSPTMISHP